MQKVVIELESSEAGAEFEYVTARADRPELSFFEERQFDREEGLFRLEFLMWSPKAGANLLRILVAYKSGDQILMLELQLLTQAFELLRPLKIVSRKLEQQKRLCEIYLCKGERLTAENSLRIVSTFFNE